MKINLATVFYLSGLAIAAPNSRSHGAIQTRQIVTADQISDLASQLLQTRGTVEGTMNPQLSNARAVIDGLTGSGSNGNDVGTLRSQLDQAGSLAGQLADVLGQMASTAQGLVAAYQGVEDGGVPGAFFG
ncbi:hypothetical protein QBC34DRAFT_478134 [Podospora aff. communis PSN243]|uniref:Uncharacterized protein n=1 Tax=Podospora aff. communis PSN243 TaxID=3040156 RepID=A0AAV9G6Z3_9PEZI|nr:hypothetical protein QBC34DRAFT_478134 [Podospora aff. communis PSN243]